MFLSLVVHVAFQGATSTAAIFPLAAVSASSGGVMRPQAATRGLSARGGDVICGAAHAVRPLRSAGRCALVMRRWPDGRCAACAMRCACEAAKLKRPRVDFYTAERKPEALSRILC